MTTKPSPAIDYDKLFHSLGTAYIVFGIDDPLFTIIEENEAHASVAMVRREDVIGRPVLEAFPDNSTQYKETGVSELLESIRRVIATGKPDAMPDLKYDLKDEQGKFIQKFWSVSHHPVFDDNNKVIAVYQATEDITDRVKTEQKLDLAQYQLSEALAHGSIGTWLWNIPDEKVFGDQNLASLFGLSDDDVKSGVPLDIFMQSIHLDDQQRVANEIEQALDSRTLYESEYRTINKQGAVCWVIARGRVELDETGAPVRFPGVIVDITQRKNAENNLNFLNKASVQFAASLDYKKTLSAVAAMVVPDVADWCTIDVLNEAGELQQVAVAHKDPKKVRWAEALRAQQGPPDINAPAGVPKVIRTGEPEFIPEVTDEMLVASAKDDKELAILRELGFSSVIIAPLKINKRVVGAISFISTESHIHYKPVDLEIASSLASRAAMAVENAQLYQDAQREIKQRKHLQKELEVANHALEARVQQRTKQLEATNRGLEQEIIKRHEAEAVLQESTRDLARSNQELEDFAYVASHDLQEPLRKIQAFGDLLQSEFGAELGPGEEYLKRMRSAASRMSVLIEDLLAFSRVSTKEQQLERIDLSSLVEGVVGDLEARIQRTNGRVEVGPLPEVWSDHTHMRQLFQNLIGNALKFHREGVPPVVKVRADASRTSETHSVIRIEDNGIGFDEKYLDRIFSVFQRLHGREQYEGTGIGLAVCRKIVERYNGTITAESTPGEGSAFIISMPKHDKETIA